MKKPSNTIKENLSKVGFKVDKGAFSPFDREIMKALDEEKERVNGILMKLLYFIDSGEKMDLGTFIKVKSMIDETVTSSDTEGIIDCDHVCTSNCRRVGCNCDCGEYHEEKNRKQKTEIYLCKSIWENRKIKHCTCGKCI